MLLMPTFLRRTHEGHYSTPKTVLGFYAGVLIILEAGVLGALAVLAATDSLHYLIPWVLAFGGAMLLSLLVVVVAMNIRDPTKLQLGEVTGKEFLDYQQVTRGDSISGEYVESVPVTPTADPRPAIEAGTENGREEVEGSSTDG